MSQTESKDRDENGLFVKNTSVGIQTRFGKGNAASLKYRDEYCEAMLAYFTERDREVIYEEQYHENGTIKKRIPKMVFAPRYPTFEGFAASIGVTSRTLRDWASTDENGKPKHARFSLAYALAKDMQLAIAKQLAMTKEYDSNFAKFVLINDHGLSDRVVHENEQAAPFEVQINVVK